MIKFVPKLNQCTYVFFLRDNFAYLTYEVRPITVDLVYNVTTISEFKNYSKNQDQQGLHRP